MARTKQFCEHQTLDKAIELFWKQGFNGTSISDLVGYLGVNRASLYDTYGGKKELFEKALDRYMERSHASAETLLTGERSGKETIRRFLTAVAESAAHDEDFKGCFAANVTAELSSDKAVKQRLQQNEAFFEAMFGRLLRKAQEEGDLSAEADVKGIAFFLFTFISGLKLVSKAGVPEERLQAAVDSAMSVFNR